MVAISALAAVAVALFAAVPAFADVSLGEPEHSKTATLDPNTGKINITLSVTGNTDTSESKSSANLIVVLDKSGSMKQVVDKKVSYVLDDSWHWWSERYGLVGDQYVSLSRKGFLGNYSYYYYDNNGNEVEYAGQRYRRETTDVTRLDVAKSALDGLADQLISQQNSTVKISLETFADSGETPSRYYGAGEADKFKSLVNEQSAYGGTNWTDALAKANQKAAEDSSTPTYIVFLSDGAPTYGKNDGDGTYTDDQFVTDAVEVANKRPSNVVGFYAIYTGSDAADSMNNFASRTNASSKAIDGSNSAALQDAFKNIVQTINKGISYTNVKITDTKSDYVDYVLPEGATKPVFTYMKNDEAWAEAPQATFVNGQVSWNLGNRKLEKGVKYSVSFEVTLNQDAYDEAAMGKLKDNQVPTNSAAQLAYSTVVTTKDHEETTDQAPIAFDVPTVTVPTCTLHVSKTWDKKGWENVSLPAQLNVQVMRDGKYYKTVTLKADAWKADVAVAAGPTDYTYTVKEEKAPADWDATLPDGVKLGLTSLEGNQTITNTIKTAKLTITKSVTGNFGDTSKAFSFTLTDAFGNAITNVKAVDGTSDGVSLGNNGSFTLENGQKLVVELPYGASYKVVENDPKGTNDTVDYTTTIDAVGDATIDRDTPRTASSPEGGITKDTTITYTNKRDVTPDVGVDLGSGAPYAAVFGGAGLAGVIWMVLKRRNSLGI